MLPGNFQVYAKIDEETRKDNHLSTSFLLTLNDARGAVTYEFRGICSIMGSSADFESVMEAHKDSRIPKILDIIYQRLYPIVFMLAGMITSSYPQSVALVTEMVSSHPVQMQQEIATTVEEYGKDKKTEQVDSVEVKSSPKATVQSPSLGMHREDPSLKDKEK